MVAAFAADAVVELVEVAAVVVGVASALTATAGVAPAAVPVTEGLVDAVDDGAVWATRLPVMAAVAATDSPAAAHRDRRAAWRRRVGVEVGRFSFMGPMVGPGVEGSLSEG